MTDEATLRLYEEAKRALYHIYGYGSETVDECVVRIANAVEANHKGLAVAIRTFETQHFPEKMLRKEG